MSNARARHMTRRQGFTLIELLVAVAIAAILAAIALPMYQQSVRKSRRGEAQAALLNMQMQQEKWRVNNAQYTTSLTTLGAPATGSALLNHYQFSVTGVTSTTYTLRAVAIAGRTQARDRQGSVSCTPLTINQSGTRSPAACW